MKLMKLMKAIASLVLDFILAISVILVYVTISGISICYGVAVLFSGLFSYAKTGMLVSAVISLIVGVTTLIFGGIYIRNNVLN